MCIVVGTGLKAQQEGREVSVCIGPDDEIDAS
jgi:hypothetical protein